MIRPVNGALDQTDDWKAKNFIYDSRVIISGDIVYRKYFVESTRVRFLSASREV